jgi:hypothetical protein
MGNKVKMQHNLMHEVITDFFGSLVEKTHQIDPGLIKPYRREIVELFNDESFFDATVLKLRHWQKILKYFIDGKPEEILED